MDFLRNSAVASGVAVSDLQGSFVKFVASTKAANIPMSVTNDLFLSTARAAGTDCGAAPQWLSRVGID